MADTEQGATEWVKRSIQRVLDQLNWKYLSDDDVGTREVVCIFGSGELGNWVLINRILAPKGVLLIMATCQENVPVGAQRQAAVEFITRANFGILNGFFDMDLTDGDLRFSSRVEYGLMANAAQFEANFKQTFQIVHGTFSKYLAGVIGVTKKGMSGKHAVELIEGGANTLPNPSQAPLLAIVARHLSASNTNYVSHPEKGVIRMPCTVQGVTFHLRIKAMEETEHLYVFCNYPRTGGKIPIHHIPVITEFVSRANWALPFGYFDMDLSDGELRFVTWLPTNGIKPIDIQTQFARSLIVSAITTFVKYLPGIDGLISGQIAKPSAAIDQVEADRPAGLAANENISRIMDAGTASSDDDDHDVNAKTAHSPDQDARDDLDDGTSISDGDSKSPKIRSVVRLELNADGSGMGALEFIGSKGRSIPWTNPFESGQISISSSGTTSAGAPGGNGGDLGDIVSRSASKLFLTQASERPWVCLDLKQCSLAPSHYMVSHTISSDTDILRSWEFQASNNGGQSWATLSRHDADLTLHGRTPRKVWPIVMGDARSFTMFRIVMTGPNSCHRMQLGLGQIELFGKLTVDFPVEPHLVDVAEHDPEGQSARDPALVRADIVCGFASDDRIGSGIHGDTFRGFYNGFMVAIKRISYRAQDADWRRGRYRSLKEYVTGGAALHEPGLVRVLGVADDESQQSWLLISEMIADPTPIVAISVPATRLHLSITIARSLSHLHSQSRSHGSLHPGNVLVAYDGSSVRLSDSAIFDHLPPLLSSQLIQGHIGFCAPELLSSSTTSAAADPIAADLYSLAMILYAIWTGHYPYHDLVATSSSALLSRILLGCRPAIPEHVPDPLSATLKSLWDSAPGNRPSSSQVQQTLQKLVIR